MIKVCFLVALSYLLVSNTAYSRTEIKPPEGPFQSLLRATFLTTGTDSKLKKPTEKTYTFKVPDLGRYQERSPSARIAIEQEFSKKSNDAFNLSNHDDSTNEMPLTFDPNAFSSGNAGGGHDMNGEQNVSPYEGVTTPNTNVIPSKNMPFDDLPIGYGSIEDIKSYPREWAEQPPYLQAPNFSSPFNVQNQSAFQNRGGSSPAMMGMPMPSQIPFPPINNNPSPGYN